jgi:hypothetical protein
MADSVIAESDEKVTEIHGPVAKTDSSQDDKKLQTTSFETAQL